MIKKTTRYLTAFLLSATMVLSLSIFALAIEPGFDNFIYSDSFTSGQFSDVDDSDWFSGYVRDAYNFGFLRGRSETSFEPGGHLTLGEAVTLAARLNSIYRTGSADFPASVPFYTVYTEYALTHSIIDRHGDYSAPITRAQFALVMYNALPSEAFTTTNTIEEFGINDVAPDTTTGRAIYTLYRAGIMTGSDRFGTFFGATKITRAEASAIMVRLASTSARVGMRLPSYIPTEMLFQRSTDAVFMIDTFDEYFNFIRSGSGFFINSDGLAVTALHVIDSAHHAIITLFDGRVYAVSGVRAYDIESNLALFEIDSARRDWRYLILADSDLIEVGNSIYAIGSPRHLINSMSKGIIAFVSRGEGADEMIQFTAPISFGSGGGPVLNTLGQVIGVASSSFVYGQNLNLAIPVNLIRDIQPGSLMTLEEFQAAIMAMQ